MSEYLLEARELTKEFPAAGKKTVHAVSGVSLQIRKGETLGLVGESGCGKSTLGRLLIRTLQPTSGEVLFCGQSVTRMKDSEFKERVRELLRAVGVPEEFLHRYPHQFSGGQRQRIGIARAIAANPSFIVCDEPVSALDVSVQNQILNLLKELKETRDLTYLFISHDLSVVRYLADRVCVMFLGKICEIGPTEEVYEHPRHPYTRFLLDAVPVPDPAARGKQIHLLKGEAPSPADPPSGCRFRTRCPYATERCAEEEPALQEEDGVRAACHCAGKW